MPHEGLSLWLNAACKAICCATSGAWASAPDEPVGSGGACSGWAM